VSVLFPLVPLRLLCSPSLSCSHSPTETPLVTLSVCLLSSASCLSFLVLFILSIHLLCSSLFLVLLFSSLLLVCSLVSLFVLSTPLPFLFVCLIYTYFPAISSTSTYYNRKAVELCAQLHTVWPVYREAVELSALPRLIGGCTPVCCI
jgi:hypothetical protein